jgi:hypothetical protein
MREGGAKNVAMPAEASAKLDYAKCGSALLIYEFATTEARGEMPNSVNIDIDDLLGMNVDEQHLQFIFNSKTFYCAGFLISCFHSILALRDVTNVC